MRRTLVILWTLLLLPAAAPAQDSTSAGDDAVVPGWREEFREEYELFRDYGDDWRLGTFFAVNSEDGVILAGGPILYRFDFRTFPYVSRMELLAGVSIPTARFKIVYSALWPSLSDRWSLGLTAHFSQLELRNFYGFGNDAGRDENLEEQNFYVVSSNDILIDPVLRFAVARGLTAGFAASVRTVDAEREEDRFLSDSDFTEFGDNRTVGSVALSLTFDSRDHPLAPHSGFLLFAEARNYLEVFGHEQPFRKYTGDIRFYAGGEVVTDVMLALRIRGEKLTGAFPFYEAAFLGGTSSLRGFPSQRFAGDASLFASGELRLSIGRWKIIIPTDVGVMFLADAGRVWVDGASPGSLHTGAGGGIWIAPLSRDTILSLSVASSKEGLFIGGGFGFGF